MKLTKIYNEYLEAIGIWKSRGLNVVTYDYTLDPDATTVKLRLSTMFRHVANPGTGVGSWNAARWLLIGTDTVGCRRPPFTSMSADSIGTWLACRLEEWRVPEYTMYWLNQNEVSELRPSATLEKRFSNRIVALGGEAKSWCEKYGLHHHHVAHPTFWRTRADPYPLKDLLCSIAH